jgi:hypothetical protein
MNKSPNKSQTSLVAYFLLALFFALLSVLANRPTEIHHSGQGIGISIDTRWMFWLLLALSAACLTPLIASVLQTLHQQKKTPQFLRFLFEADFREQANRFVLKTRVHLFGDVGLIVITGGAILLLVAYLHQTRAVDDDAVNGNLYDLSLQLRGAHSSPQQFSAVSRLLYLTADVNPVHQLRDCSDIVKRLKNAGAKAVLVSFPDFSTVVDESFEMVNEIESSGIVVWGVPMGSKSIPWTRMADSTGKIRLSKATYLSRNEEMWKGSMLARVRISYGRAVGNAGGDVIATLLQKIQGIPYYQSAKNNDGAIDVGNYTVPLSNEGWMYSLDHYAGSVHPDIYVHRGQNWAIGRTYWFTDVLHSQENTRYTGKGKDLDSLRYSIRLRGDASSSPAEPIDERTFEAKVKGKIVLLVSNHGMTSGSYLPDRAYAVALENILQGSVMKKADHSYIWYSFVWLAVAGYVAIRFRALVAILLMFVLALCALWFGSYLYETRNVLIDIFYPLLSIAIAIIVFPAVATAQRWRQGEG